MSVAAWSTVPPLLLNEKPHQIERRNMMTQLSRRGLRACGLQRSVAHDGAMADDAVSMEEHPIAVKSAGAASHSVGYRLGGASPTGLALVGGAADRCKRCHTANTPALPSSQVGAQAGELRAAGARHHVRLGRRLWQP